MRVVNFSFFCYFEKTIYFHSNFFKARRVTVLGQILDGDTESVEDCTWQRLILQELLDLLITILYYFSMIDFRHWAITQHKTSHYTYFTPLQVAALLTAQPLIIEPLKLISYQLGYLFQSKVSFLLNLDLNAVNSVI